MTQSPQGSRPVFDILVVKASNKLRLKQAFDRIFVSLIGFDPIK